MIFNRFEFILAFLPAIVLVSFIIPRSYLFAWLALASLFFYGWSAELSVATWIHILPFLFFITVNYFISKQIEQSGTARLRRLIVWVGVLFNVAWWILLKIQLLSNFGPFSEMVVSIGLGFYVLRAIGYLVDVNHRRLPAASNILIFFLYLAFFAHIPAGPITSWKWFSDHLENRLQSTELPYWQAGFYLFSMGMLKKAIADTLGSQIDPAIDGEGVLGFVTSWVMLLGYTAQVYLDFTGYTDMALGIGRMIGIQLPPNFDKPYLKRNLIEFWNAWHITLSHWLRDYIFTPLGRLFFSINMLRRSPLLIASLCYLVTFTVCGIWHGLESTFLLWGIYHGLGLSCCKIYGEVARKSFPPAYFNFMFKTRSGYGIAMGANFLFVAVGWVFFRSRSVPQSIEWLKGLLGYYTSAGLYDHPNLVIGLIVLVVAGGVINRFQWHIENLAYWQKITLTANFMIVLFYYYISKNVGMTPFIYNVF